MSQPVELFVKPAISAQPQADDSDSIWKKELAKATRSVTSLLQQLELGSHIALTDIQPDFRCLVTDSYINKMRPGDINDPLLQQVLPLRRENDT